MDIGGTGLVARARENGSGYDVGAEGSGLSLDADGAGEITDPDGGMFRVMKNDAGMLAGTRYDLDMEGEVMAIETIAPPHGSEPKLSVDDRKTAGVNEKNTMLEALGEDFPIGDLLGGGAATVTGDNIVATARGEMVKIRDRVAALVDLRNDDGIDNDAFNTQIDNQWDAADVQMEAIFGGNRELERTSSASRVVDAFDRVVRALSSEEAFAAATLADGPDQLDGFVTGSAAAAATRFNRNKSTATARLGASGSTRYGVAVYNDTDKVQDAFKTAERAQAFAWSTVERVRRASDVQAAGTATYNGGTLAADHEGNLYSGTIDVTVSFTRMSVNGLVTELARADTQAPWTYGLGGEVTGIHLPDATLTRRGLWTVEGSGNNTGRLQYEPQAGGEPDLDLEDGEATFAGRLLGRGDASGDEAIGTWSVQRGTTMLAGGFGAARGADRAPPGAAVTGDLATIGKRGENTWARIENVPIKLNQIPPKDPDADPPVVATSPQINASTVLDLTNAKFKYNPPTRDAIPATEYVTGNYTPGRADVVEAGEHEETKGNWVESAHTEITKKLAQLRRIINLDTAESTDQDRAFSKQQRQRLFDDIQAELTKVLGDGSNPAEGDNDVYTGVLTRESDTAAANADYPVNTSGTPEDAGVLAEIEEVLAALADADAFAAAFDSGGVFAATKAATDGTGEGAPNLFPDGYPTPSAMFTRARGKLTMSTDNTSFTRFGGWNHQVSANASQGLAPQNVTNESGRTGPGADGRGREFGAFVYSPLEPTAAYANESSRLYPAGATTNVTATYTGRTIAAQGQLFYRGDVEATVFWNATSVTESQVRLTISNIVENESGDTLEFGLAPPADHPTAMQPLVGVAEVDSLSWTTKIDNTGTVDFESTTPVTVTVNDVDGTPNWRPGYGSGVRGEVTRHFDIQSTSTVNQNDQLRIGTDDSNYWIAEVGSGSDDYGVLTWGGIDTERHERRSGNAYATTSGQTFDDAKEAFEDGQDNLVYPRYIIQGVNVRPAGTTSNTRGSSILLFDDGSTLHIDRYFDHNTAPIGTGTGTASAEYYEAYRMDGDPLLSADDNKLLYNDLGQPWSKDFLTTDGTGNTIGAGREDLPTGMTTPGALAAAYLRDGGYVNVRESDLGARASKIEGMFVGQDQQGPLGIIGTWSLTGGAFGTGTERGDIRGAFGADFTPEP